MKKTSQFLLCVTLVGLTHVAFATTPLPPGDNTRPVSSSSAPYPPCLAQVTPCSDVVNKIWSHLSDQTRTEYDRNRLTETREEIAKAIDVGTLPKEDEDLLRSQQQWIDQLLYVDGRKD